MAQKAYEHGLKINEEAMCAKPRAELVYLTDSNKIYLPRATLLHRCSDLTGCCTHATHTCQASQVENVSLYFFAVSVQSLSRLRQNQNIEKLSFVNHTECACMPVDHSRSESLVRKSESNNTVDNWPSNVTPLPSEVSTIVSGAEVSTDRVMMYSSSLSGQEATESNNIDINNGLTDSNGDNQSNMLKYWGKLLGLYKSKGYRNIDQHGEQSWARTGMNTQPTETRTEIRRRLDTHLEPTLARPSLSPTLTGTVHYHHSPVSFVPYQSQYLYMYPSAGSQYNLVNGLNANLAKHRTTDSARYRLNYRPLD